MVRCPNCALKMSAQTLEGHGANAAAAVEVDACPLCNLLWFDQSESIRLAPHAVLVLFQYIGKVAGGERTTLASSFSCPRCSGALSLTYDLQRTTRFTYWRCSRDLGQLITFNQFLRAKNFILAESFRCLVAPRLPTVSLLLPNLEGGVFLDVIDGFLGRNAKREHRLASVVRKRPCQLYSIPPVRPD